MAQPVHCMGPTAKKPSGEQLFERCHTLSVMCYGRLCFVFDRWRDQTSSCMLSPFIPFLLAQPSAIAFAGKKDNAILSFTIDALRQQVPKAGSPDLDAVVADAIRWQSQRSAEQAMRERDRILSRLEEDAKWYRHVSFCHVVFGSSVGHSRSVLLCRKTGACKRWLMGAARDIKSVSSTVCGPLFEKLAWEAKHPDVEAVEIFRQGAQLYGMLPPDGIGQLASEIEDMPDLALLQGSCENHNQELIGSLREDTNAAALQDLTCSDARKHRMSWPVPVDSIDLKSIRLAPRFAVEQGVRSDGLPKIRAVDHMSWSAAEGRSHKRSRAQVRLESINGHSHFPIQIKHDHIDDLCEALRMAYREFGELPRMWKTDIAQAFRRLPIRVDHVPWHLQIVYISGCSLVVCLLLS